MTSTKNQPTRWAIAGCGRVSSDFASSFKVLDSNCHKIVAVAARDLKRAQEFGTRFDIDRTFGSYSALADDGDFDVVYVGTIVTQHFSVVKLMLEAGKNVLCEKTLCTNPKDAEELINLARSKKVFLMEGIWTRCFPAFKKLREYLESGVIGKPMVIHGSFGYPLQDEGDKYAKINGGGAILDFAGYFIQLAALAFGPNPTSVTAVATLSQDGGDDDSTLVIRYSDGRMANILLSRRMLLKNFASIYGTNGTLEIPHHVWCPTAIVLNGASEEFPLPEIENVKFHYPNSVGFSYEAEEVRSCLIQGLTESPRIPHETSLTIAKIEAEAFKQLGIKY